MKVPSGELELQWAGEQRNRATKSTYDYGSEEARQGRLLVVKWWLIWRDGNTCGLGKPR